jgi:hypothetical protein
MRHRVSITQIPCLAHSATSDQASLLVVHNTEHDAATLLYLHIIPVLQLLNLAPHGRGVVAPAFWQKTTSRAQTDSSFLTYSLKLPATKQTISPHHIPPLARAHSPISTAHPQRFGTLCVPPLAGRQLHKHGRIPTPAAIYMTASWVRVSERSPLPYSYRDIVPCGIKNCM